MQHNFADLTGYVFERLTVVSQVPPSKGEKVAWNCLCSCGNMHVVTTTNLRTKQVKSCGCLKHEGKYGDLTGKIFGRLTVIGLSESPRRSYQKWSCLCECGSTTDSYTKQLVNGSKKSCGCLRKELAREQQLIDITGTKFGKLTVIGLSGKRIKNRDLWICKCDCGNEVETYSRYLLRGTKHSCGCIKATSNAMTTMSIVRKVYNSYRSSAKQRKLNFELELDYFYELLQKNCHYCNTQKSRRWVINNCELTYNGIDRLDNTKGYTIENSVTCCTKCNMSKGMDTKEEYIARCKAIADFHSQ